MYLKCAQPDCSSEFDHTQGRLFRFHQISRREDQPKDWHAVKHYWLCGRCSQDFTIEYLDRLGVVLKPREELAGAGHLGYIILQDEAAREKVKAIGRDEMEIEEIAVQKGDYAPDE